ncbi:MAG: DUF2474 domain-containing protein [Pseudomonadota bacterium]|nr:DUF2474 domain-containing protein [Pseudomonadota bacterium]
MSDVPEKPRRKGKQLLWFVAIYGLSVAAIGTVAWFIRLWIA